MAKIEPANLLLKDKNGNTGLVKSLTNKDITTLKNVITNVNYIKDFVNANGGSLPVQGDIHLTATDAAGKNGKTLLGTSSGTLQWNGKNIVRSVNGVNADANGNVKGFFPSSTFISITATHNAEFIAPTNGWIYIEGTKNRSSTFGKVRLFIYNELNFSRMIDNESTLDTNSYSIITPLSKGEKVVFYIFNSNSVKCRFVYAQGEEA